MKPRSLALGSLVAMLSILTVALSLGVAGPLRAQAPTAAPQGGPVAQLDPRETHLADLRQLTFGGENAEAYWAPNGQELILQSSHPPYACDQIFRLPIDGQHPMQLVSTGQGRTTCSYFAYPKADRIYFASTHLAGAECPPPPDQSLGYVWALYDSYEIFSAKPDGSDLVQLTHNTAYDAEATVCPRDGSLVFTSTRDGDIDLYRMDADGSNVRRLTDTPGYDGGAFFSADCQQIVWRASRPRPGKELDDYRQLLAQGLVRPSRLEVFVADADGTHARQVTYLNSASFAPFLFPDGKRILFSSNYPNPRGREFDIWAINTDGTGLERITYAEEFDGFPMFSPDGKLLAFSSNRNHAKPGETNVFVARWVDGPVKVEESAADRYQADVRWLADDAREGRGIGTAGLEASAQWLSERFAQLGLEPAGEGGTYRQPFEILAAVNVGPSTALALDGAAVPAEDFLPAAFSASTMAAGPVVFAGYGITSAEHGIDDYAGLDVRGKVALVRRFTPSGPPFDDTTVERRLSDLRYKAFNAREHGAVGLLVVDLPPGDNPPDEAKMPRLDLEAPGDAGIPVVLVSRRVGAPLVAGEHQATLTVALELQYAPAANIVGRLRAGAAEKLPGAVLVGAHYDHLGFGDRHSLSPGEHAIHNGADDNASGTAALLTAARELKARQPELERDVWVVAFAGEESGVLGSSHLARQPVPGLVIGDLEAMINMDMVGRMSANHLSVLGGESAAEWKEIVPPLCDAARVLCDLGGDGYGPSDQTPFYAAGVPVVHFFTGVHDDYHRPSDDWERINAAGGAKVGELAAALAVTLARRQQPLTYKQVAAPPPAGDVRSFGASLGTIPDYAGVEGGKKGVPLAGVRPGSPAEAAGMQRGDILVELAGHPIGDIQDFVFVLRQAKPGDKATAVVERDGRRIEMVVTYGVSRGRV